jgi:toxin FitB
MSKTIFILDTNVISELAKLGPYTKVVEWLKSVEHLAVSAVTIEEAHYGFAWQPHARKLAIFSEFVQRMCAIYPISGAIAQRAGVMRGQFQAHGVTRSVQDILIAATALAHQLILAMRNQKDFIGCGVQLINPLIPSEH